MKNRKLSLRVYTLGLLGDCILNKQQKLIGEMTPFHLKYYFPYRFLGKSGDKDKQGHQNDRDAGTAIKVINSLQVEWVYAWDHLLEFISFYHFSSLQQVLSQHLCLDLQTLQLHLTHFLTFQPQTLLHHQLPYSPFVGSLAECATKPAIVGGCIIHRIHLICDNRINKGPEDYQRRYC